MNSDANASAARRIHDRDARHILVLILDAAPELRKHVLAIVAATNAEPGTKPPQGGPEPDIQRLARHAQALNSEFGALARRVERAKTPQTKDGFEGKQKMMDCLFDFERAMAHFVEATYDVNQKGYKRSHIQQARRDMDKARTEGKAALRILQR